jgi:hypothetical protein
MDTSTIAELENEDLILNNLKGWELDPSNGIQGDFTALKSFVFGEEPMAVDDCKDEATSQAFDRLNLIDSRRFLQFVLNFQAKFSPVIFQSKARTSMTLPF